MVGYVSEAVAQALRTWKPLKKLNIIPVRATDGMSVVVNTPIPAIAVHVSGEDGSGNTYFGGGIRFYFELQLHVIIPLTNYTFTPDGGKQTELLDSSEDVVRCVEQSELLLDVKRRHDLNLQFDRLETYSTYATQNAMSVAVEVHKVVYKGDVEFVPYPEGDPWYKELKRVEIDNGVNKSVIE